MGYLNLYQGYFIGDFYFNFFFFLNKLIYILILYDNKFLKIRYLYILVNENRFEKDMIFE